VAAISRNLQAQDRSSDANETSVSASVSADALNSHGFSFDDHERPMCKIEGPEGVCRVEAFVSGEKSSDSDAHSCNKLNKATYFGHCVGGKLDGLSLVIADGSSKSNKESFLSYFSRGRMAYPAVTSYFDGSLSFGVKEIMSSYGCVYFGKWDRSEERCKALIDVYGVDLFSESNAQKLRDGAFDLDRYRTRFMAYIQGANSVPVKTGAAIVIGKLIHKVTPIYPASALANQVQGTVTLAILTDKQGRITEMKPVSGPQELIPAAEAAARQWIYEPTTWEGEPIEFKRQISINFVLP
jgi:TonB family protein